MRKFLLTICMALPTLFVLGQSPGGVPTPTAWYRADASVFSDAGTTSAANNASVYQWNDYLGTGRNLVQTTAARRPVYSNTTTLANFNPTVTFTRTSTHWMQCDPGAGNEIINRASGTFYSAGYMDSDFLGTGSGSGLIGFNTDMDYPGLHTSNNTQFNLLMYAENGANYTPISTNAFTYKNSFIAGSSWQNGASTTSPATYGAATISLNGTRTFYSSNNFRNVNTVNTARQFRIGGDDDWGSHNGQLNEVLIYQNILTSQEKDRLESYLAIKYGTTLSGNYLNSTNGIVWNSDAIYQNNIFGIARDNNGALHQKQSRSENKDQKLIIGNGSGLFNTNAANTNSLSDGQFLIVGDNGLKQALSTPLVYTGGTNGATNYRFESVWKVQNTSGTGQVTVAWPKGIANMYLVQSSDQTFATGNSYTPMATEVTVNGVVYNTVTVTLTNGEFFTFAGFEYAPGGVAAAAWYRADGTANLFSDAGTTAAADNATIQQWNEFNNKPFPLSQATANLKPEFSNATTLVNFNPTVNYTTSSKWLQYDGNALGNIIDRSTGALFSAGNTTGTTAFFGFGASGAGNTMDDPGLYNFTGNKFLFYPIIGEYDPVSTYSINGPYIGGGTWQNGAGIGGNNAVDITLNGYHQTYNTGINNVTMVATRNALMAGGAETSVAFQQNEMIVFPSKLTDQETNKVESYLAIKYGQTLSKEQNRNYLSSTGAVVWEGTINDNYYNNVFGIARDNISALYQKQSKSVNANQKLLIGAGNTLTNTNAANTNTLTEGQFLIVGDNGLQQSFTTALLNTAAPGGETNIRFASIWKVQNTGTVGQVIVAWPKGVSNLHLVQSSDEIFDNTDTFTSMAAEVTVNGVVYNTATANLGNGQFFTFAGFAHAPGGVAGPDLWVKSDDAGDISTAWKDQSLNEDNIPAVGTWTLSPADREHNFHPYTAGYTGTKYFLNTNSVLNPTNGQLDNVSYSIFSAVRPTTAGTGRITGIDDDVNAAEPGFSIDGGNLRFYKFSGGANADQFDEEPFKIGSVNIVSGIGNNPIVAGGTSTAVGGERVLGMNGIYKTYPNTTSSNRFHFQGQRLRIGDGAWSAIGSFPGDIMEVVWYKRPLTANEQSRVNSYLAVKNGTTLNENYLSTTSNVVWDRTNNTSYNNNIFGIARDNITALHQKQSTSSNASQKLVIGNSSSLFNTNAYNTNDLTEGQYLIVGDNGLRQGLSTPLAYTAGTNGETNYRFESIWKAQKTSGVGTVTVAWPKGIQNFYLVQSTDEIITGGDTFTPMITEVTVNGVVYNTATVTLGNGQFFTFAGYGHAPGGVVNSLSYWYRADKDAINTGAGTDVTSWTDYFSGTVVGQMGTNAFPKYTDGAANYFNFNPGVNFTAGTQTLGNVSVRTFSADSYDVFTFTKEGMTSGGAFSSIFRSLVDNAFLTGGLRRWDGLGIEMDNGIERYSNTGGSTDTGVFTSPGAFSGTIPSIMYHTFTANSTTRALNGAANFGTTNHAGTGVRNLNGGHLFGDSQFGGNGSDNRGFIGHLGETIIYGAGNLSAEERRRVDSYMAIKYGITLGRVGTDHYLGSTASPTSIVWSGTLNAVYNNNIFGIARADIGGFDQKVSKSVNSGTILTIAKDNDFVSSNLAPSRTGLPVNEGYLLLGDNNNTSTVAYTPTEIGNCGEIIGATEQIKLIPRKWLVQRTSSVGATYLQANLAAYTADLNTDIKMYIADDENFTQNVVVISGTQSGSNWVFPYNFDNDNTARYITFGGKFVAALCEQCKGGTYTLRTGYQWNQGAWTNQTVNNKQNILLGNDADGNPLYASMYADYSANPSIEYVPTRYPRQYAGRWTTGRRYDNTNAQVQHRIELTKAMKASFQISNINTYRNNKNNFQVIGYCNGAPVMPKITYAYNTSYHTFDISGNQAIGTMSWRGFVPNVSTANVRFDRPVDRIVIICSVDRVNTDRTLRSVLYSDITLECAEVVPPTPDNVYVSHSYTQDTLATCGGNTTMRIKVTNNNICDNKTIDLHQALPAGLVYVPGSFNGNDLPAGAMAGATLTYTGGNLELSGLSLPSGEHWMYVDVANPGIVGTYPTQFTYEVTNGVNPANTYSSSVVNLNYYQSTAPVQSTPALTLSIKDNVNCGTNNMVMTYRMKIDNPNAASITGAEILHMFDHDQVIQSVTYVTGEDEDGVITGTYPVDGSGNPIDPINNNLFNLIDANIPVGVSYIDITVNTGNSYDSPDVQTLGISSTFLVGIGSGECAESGESTSNEVVLPMCAGVCYKPGIAATPGNPSLQTKVGITSLNRAGAQDADNWPMVRNGGWLALESKTKGFVINRVTFTDADSNPATPEVPVGIPAADFTEGMMVYDTTNKCLKIYTSVNNGSSFEWHCLSTQTCPD